MSAQDLPLCDSTPTMLVARPIVRGTIIDAIAVFIDIIVARTILIAMRSGTNTTALAMLFTCAVLWCMITDAIAISVNVIATQAGAVLS